MVVMNEKEIFDYCDPQMLELMGILQCADSGSYTFIEKKDEYPKNVTEFRSTNFLII